MMSPRQLIAPSTAVLMVLLCAAAAAALATPRERPLVTFEAEPVLIVAPAADAAAAIVP